MEDKILLLSVDGGEVESFLGAFRSREKLDAVMLAKGTGEGTGREEGYAYAEPEIDEQGRECIYLHDIGCEPFDYTLCFLIREVVVIG